MKNSRLELIAMATSTTLLHLGHLSALKSSLTETMILGRLVTILPTSLPPSEFYALFQKVRNRPNVTDVLVEVSQHEAPNEWPSADTIWIITSAAPEEIRGWLGERFQPDEVFNGWADDIQRENYAVSAPMKPVGLWWD